MLETLGLTIDSLGLAQSVANLLLIIALSYFIHLVFDTALTYFAKKSRNTLDNNLLVIFRVPFFLSLILIGIYWGVAPLVTADESLDRYHLVLFTCAVFLWVLASLRVINLIFATIARNTGRTHGTSFNSIIPLLTNVVKVVVVVGALGLVLNLWGLDVKPFIASAGIVGAGLAFAAKDTVSNLFGGVSVFFDKPYKIGDYVYVDDQYRGEVIDIGMRSTKIRTRDNVLLTVPNSVMVTSVVVNETGFDPKLRIRIPIDVSYTADLQKVEDLLLSIAVEDENLLKHPSPIVRYRGFGESGIRLELLGVISQPSDRGKVVHQLIKTIHTRFKKGNITIPFPQRDVHMQRV